MTGAADDAGLKVVGAKAYLKSAIALANAVWDSPDRDYATPSIYLLLAKALNLTLTAVVGAHGADAPLRDARENLEKTWSALGETPFVPPAGTRPLVSALHAACRGNWLRYTPVESSILPLPDLTMTVSTLQRIIDAVDHHLETLGVKRRDLGRDA